MILNQSITMRPGPYFAYTNHCTTGVPAGLPSVLKDHKPKVLTTMPHYPTGGPLDPKVGGFDPCIFQKTLIPTTPNTRILARGSNFHK